MHRIKRRIAPLKHCCWCFVLKAGAMFIGVVDILRGTVYMVAGLEIINKRTLFYRYDSAIGIMTAIVGGISPVFGIILILAAIFEKPRMLVLTMFHSVCFLVANLVMASWYIENHLRVNTNIAGGILLAFLLCLVSAWETYALVVIYSYYVELTKIRDSKLEFQRRSSLPNETPEQKKKREKAEAKMKRNLMNKSVTFAEMESEQSVDLSHSNTSSRMDVSSV